MKYLFTLNDPPYRMLNYTMVADVLELEDAKRHQQKGRLFEVKQEHDSLKTAIKAVK
jgi:hypothetical protein